MSNNILLVTLGHTTAGKTTLSKFLLSIPEYALSYVEEGRIKREIIGNYTTKDSLNEELRDKAYGIAIDKANTMLTSSNVLVDASFHRIERRNKVYKMLIDRNDSTSLIWLYCYCHNIQEVQNRIQKRKIAKKTAETQADSMSIYYHIVETFSLPSISEIPDSIEAAIIHIDTYNNCIDKVESTSQSKRFMSLVYTLCNYINKQLTSMECQS